MSAPPILLLAAGASRRMGDVDKLLLETPDGPLLRHTARNARAAGPVRVMLAGGRPEHHAALAGLDVAITEVPDAAEGMSAALRAGMAALPPDSPAVIIALADMPLVGPDIYARLIAAHAPDKGRLICRAVTQSGRKGHPVLFDRRFFPDLAQVRGDKGGRDILRANPQALCDVPTPGEGAACDIDTPQDWQNTPLIKDDFSCKG